jgi:SAM-dependent methyltransferase
VNPFVHKSAAARYAKGRPFFHPLVMLQVRNRLAVRKKFACALDIGCGTGLSAAALLEISNKVVGVDSSVDMGALASKASGIDYTVASAESLPFRNQVFDIITVSQVIHWLDAVAFLSEARRVTRGEGWLIVYDNFFVSHQPRLGADFEKWLNAYYRRYPKPQRREVSLEDPSTWSSAGFRLIQYDRYENDVAFSLQGLVDYLISQSNVIAAVEGGSEEIGETRRWLRESTRRFFSDSSEIDFLFAGPIVYLQRAA